MFDSHRRFVGATRAFASAALAILAVGTLGACAGDEVGAAEAVVAPAATAAAPANPTPAMPSPTATPALSYKDIAYEVAGRRVQLVNGVEEIEAAPGSASKIVTRYFGNETQADLNGDGLVDVGFLVTQSTGGSGTFYYAVVALRTPTGWAGTNAVLLGDRIAPQSTGFREGAFVVNFAERKPGEPMTARPSVGVSKYLGVTGDRLAECEACGVISRTAIP